MRCTPYLWHILAPLGGEIKEESETVSNLDLVEVDAFPYWEALCEKKSHEKDRSGYFSVLALLLPAFSPALSGAARDKKEIIRSRLANGMRAVLLEDYAAPIAAFQVWVEVGSADDHPSKAGILHLIDHMIFKGMNKRRSAKIAGSIEG
jgi:hypothetical protein